MIPHLRYYVKWDTVDSYRRLTGYPIWGTVKGTIRCQMKFKDKLKQLRIKAELTQQQLAKKAGLTLHSIRNHEQGVRLPSWQAVIRLAKALSVTTDEFASCELEPANEKPRKPNPGSTR